jgi:Rad3-related DNA helicase
VIIFDEAHNVDSVAEEGGNLEIDCKQLIFAINELKQLEKKFKF